MKAKTDLAGVKAMATKFLYLEIQQTRLSPMVVQHPFTNSGITAASKNGTMQMLDLLNKPEDLAAWRDAMAQQISEADNPTSIFYAQQAIRPAFPEIHTEISFTKRFL